ncbi:hypothetical protein F9C07_2159524 [Aspergillus flavus]|uniref:Uncharacterized protein n=1 Tax=Aspergillus flavus (strain ATCC 200026 / FGSC A1120 / IAM 13836 / NRRL 3357 / JCM 12722 / SRRC 167) TaxID=332952 RepID=A0A7U2QZU0_ASPFN|nr:hypothetical protein F9C07_2159524 [Aspergillus flavus]RAQ73384.1 hypothetical protein COH20_005034 [Aspergillus flavus]RAQ74512.1 hypothetical protein COH21_003646 [Aspergillus flavus]UDD60643.1 hypothetical protein AFCA_008033 [Aspergillus flavus]
MHFHVKHGILLAAFFGLHLGTPVGAGSSDNVLSTKIESPSQSASETALPQLVLPAVTTNEASPDIIPNLEHPPVVKFKHKVHSIGAASSQPLHGNSLLGKLVGLLHERAQKIVIERWDGLLKHTRTNPTFVLDRRIPMFGTGYQDLEVDIFAKEGWESMMEQGPRKGKKADLMGALYIPRQGVYLCSVPDGPAIERIKGTGKEVAPAWWARVQGREPNVLHAEDCTAYRYELSRTNKLAPQMTYPGGSYFAIFGNFTDETSKIRTRPEWVSPCSGGGWSPIDPHCTQVLRSLGIGFKDRSQLQALNNQHNN